MLKWDSSDECWERIRGNTREATKHSSTRWISVSAPWKWLEMQRVAVPTRVTFLLLRGFGFWFFSNSVRIYDSFIDYLFSSAPPPPSVVLRTYLSMQCTWSDGGSSRYVFYLSFSMHIELFLFSLSTNKLIGEAWLWLLVYVREDRIFTNN